MGRIFDLSNRSKEETPCTAVDLPGLGGRVREDHGRESTQAPVPTSEGDWENSITRVIPADAPHFAAFLTPEKRHAYAIEQYRIIRTRIVQRLGRHFRLVVTSAGVGDGKTFTAVNIATALAFKNEGSTLLIDGDLRNGRVHRQLGLPASPGLADVLAGSCALEKATIRVEQLPSLFVLPAGKSDGNPAELLDSFHWHCLTDIAGRRFAHIIMDSPPVDMLADYDLVAAVCDGVVLVVRPDHTNRTLFLSALDKVQSKLTGVLVNAAPDWFLARRTSRKYYSYYENKREDAG